MSLFPARNELNQSFFLQVVWERAEPELFGPYHSEESVLEAARSHYQKTQLDDLFVMRVTVSKTQTVGAEIRPLLASLFKAKVAA